MRRMLTWAVYLPGWGFPWVRKTIGYAGEGIRKKIERMKALELDALHISHCTHKKDDNGEKHLCPKIKAIIDELQEAGITIVDGTH